MILVCRSSKLCVKYDFFDDDDDDDDDGDIYDDNDIMIKIMLTPSQINSCFYICVVGAISSFPAVFPMVFENFLTFSSNFKLLSSNSFSLERAKICCLL